jgi:HEAT repeat protein
MAFIKSKLTNLPSEEEHKLTCPDLICELSNDEPDARRWAARDLIACPDSSLALVDRLKVEQILSVREVILTTLIRLGDPAAVVGLVDCLRSDDVALRNEAIDAMKQLPDEVAPLIQGLLSDSDPDVRIFAVNVLESMRHPEVEAWLVKVIQADMHVNVCAAALDLLSEVGSAGIRKPLEDIKARFAHEPYIQFAADLALSRIGGD